MAQPSDPQPTRVLLEALKSELHFYRDFFWRYQDALRAAAVADPDLAELLNGFDTPSNDCEPGTHKPFTVGYELQLAEAKCRSLDDEATTMHEHFRRRIGELEAAVQQERQQRAHVLKENIQLREANHALCCEVRRLRDGCSELSSLHLSRLQMIFLLVDEHIWRARIEAEALRYLTLRAVDTPQVNHLVNRTASIGAATHTHTFNEFLSSASSRTRLSGAVSHVFDSYYPTTRFAARDVAFSVSQCEDQFELIAGEFRHRMRALAFPESLVAARRALLKAHGADDDDVGSTVGGLSSDVRRRQRVARYATAGSRRGLTDEDEALVELCLAAYRSDKGQALLEHDDDTAAAAHDHGSQSLAEIVASKLNAMPTISAFQSKRRSVSPSSSPVVVSDTKDEDTGLHTMLQSVVESRSANDAAVINNNYPSYPATAAEVTKQRAAHLVRQFHDPLASIRSSSNSDAFIVAAADHHDGRSTNVPAAAAAAAAAAAPSAAEDAIETFLSRRAIRLLNAADGSTAAQQFNSKFNTLRNAGDVGGGPESAVLSGHPPSMMVVACSALDPLVKTQQQLRSTVLQLQRERDEAMMRNTDLEQRLAEARATASRQRLRSVDQALHRMAEVGQDDEIVRHAPAQNAGMLAPMHGAVSDTHVSFQQVGEVAGEALQLRKEVSPTQLASSSGVLLPEPHTPHSTTSHSRLGALPHQVVDRIAQASVDMKDIEAIARMSQDPSLRGRMMRQMKELHHEVAELLR
jgi:hypothetical protein